MADITKRIGLLYKDYGLSGVKIASRLGIGQRQVYRLMKKSGINARTPSQANFTSFLKKPLSFKLKKIVTERDRSLLTSALMIYWAEGSKSKNKNTIDLANSDPDMIRVFIKFLREICRVDEGKLRAYLYCYSNQDVGYLRRFWSKATGIPLLQFTKPYVRTDFKEDKVGKMPYGLIHIRYCDKKLYMQMEAWQKDVLHKLIGQVAE